MDNQYYLLACNRIKDFGPRRIALCMENWPNLADLFRASVVELQQVGLPKQVAQSIKTFDFSGVDEDMIWLNKNPNHHVLTLGAPHYPRLLAEIYDPPPVLYARGELRCLDQALLAMVGSRQPSVMGEETAWRFAHELAQAHVTIVSGLAMGIDAQAHRGCLSAGGATIAVMGTGMNIIYPRQHQDLAEKIVENGLLMSEFPLNTSPNAGHFPRRNRIISGLSSATLVVEAAVRSGSLITARFAMEQNRDVFAIPGSIHHVQARGCHVLLKQGAVLVTSSQDVREEMGVSPDLLRKDIPIDTKVCDNKSLLKHIGFEPTSIDQVLHRSGLCLEDVLCGVVELELKGWIQVVPGGYMRCQ